MSGTTEDDLQIHQLTEVGPLGPNDLLVVEQNGITGKKNLGALPGLAGNNQTFQTIFIPGTIAASTEMYAMPLPSTNAYPDGWANSQFTCGTAPASEWQCFIYNGSTLIGTATMPQGFTTGSISGPGGPCSNLVIMSQDSTDGSFASPSLFLQGTM